MPDAKTFTRDKIVQSIFNTLTNETQDINKWAIPKNKGQAFAICKTVYMNAVKFLVSGDNLEGLLVQPTLDSKVESVAARTARQLQEPPYKSTEWFNQLEQGIQSAYIQGATTMRKKLLRRLVNRIRNSPFDAATKAQFYEFFQSLNEVAISEDPDEEE